MYVVVKTCPDLCAATSILRSHVSDLSVLSMRTEKSKLVITTSNKVGYQIESGQGTILVHVWKPAEEPIRNQKEKAELASSLHMEMR